MKRHLFIFVVLSSLTSIALSGCGSDSTTSDPAPDRPEPSSTSTSSEPMPDSIAPSTAVTSKDVTATPLQSIAPGEMTQPADGPVQSAPIQNQIDQTSRTAEAPSQASISKPPLSQVVPASTQSQNGLKDSFYTSSNLQGYIGRIEINGVLLGVRISVNSSYTLSQAALQMYRVGVPDQDIVIGVYTHDSGNNQPGTRVGPWSRPVNNANLAAFPGQKVTFSGLNAAVTPGTYWIVAYPASGFGDNHFNYSGIAGTNQLSYFGDEHLQPRESRWGEKMYAQVNYWLYGG